MSKLGNSLSTMDFINAVREQEFLKTLTRMGLIVGTGIGLMWLVGIASRVNIPQRALRNNVPVPRITRELGSVLPKLQDEFRESNGEFTNYHYEVWSIFEYSQPPHLDSYITLLGLPIIKFYRAGYSKWTAYNLPATKDDIKSRWSDNEQVGIDEDIREMNPMAYNELQQLLESKRLAAKEGKSPYNMFKVVMLKCVSGHEEETLADRFGWKRLGWGFGHEPTPGGVEYGILIRGTKTRKHHAPRKPRNLDFEVGWTGWQMMGSRPQDYQRNIEHVGEGDINVSFASKGGDACKEGFGAMAQIIDASDYRRKRVRMTAFVKSEEIEQWAGLWMRVDGPEDEVQSFDNMQDRPIHGSSDWTRHDIVLPVFEDSCEIFFGVLLNGAGKIWLRDIQLDVVG